ncbi:TetR/AcrR family transcriptional regulator [Aldersonia kunmingensis]|uniref:TetR/AcrR family transcriptional regulator n=1 Tax=Aldersonia kunmingensis TaxID=408066 RepID=UPI000A078B31|nr:TetR/AcrR family transcriptional regulator [Aldersonia kunmingensis]
MADTEPTETTPVPAGNSRFAPLWEPPTATSARGRPARVNRAQVVDAAVAVADENGLDAVSMRSVARALGVGTMTLYSHVPGRDLLIDAMIDRAYADFALPEAELPWRAALEAYARGSFALMRAHPWLLSVNSWRMPLAPHVFEAEEAGFRILIDTGLTATQVVETISILNQAVSGFARAAAAEDADQRAQGTDYEAYWAAQTDFWQNTFDPTRFPTMTRLWTVGAFDNGATPFDLRIGALLDTIALLIERSDPPGAIPSFDECMQVPWPEPETGCDSPDFGSAESSPATAAESSPPTSLEAAAADSA